MGFTISYKTLFEVKVLHHFFLDRVEMRFDNMDMDGKGRALKGYDIRDFISIEPTTDCAKLLGKYHLIFRNSPLGLVVGTKAISKDGKFLPALAFDKDLRFTFKISFNDSYFLNYTALPLLPNNGMMYYFQNSTDKSAKEFPNLSQFAPVFAHGHIYSAGDLLGDAESAPTQVFIAKKITGNTPPHADWEEDVLVAGKPLQYVTGKDLLPVYSDLIRYNTDEEGLALAVTIKNRMGDTINPKFKKIVDNNKSVALVEIHALPEDYYTITLKDDSKPYEKEFSFYRLSFPGNAGALLSILVKSNDAAYDLIAADDSLNAPVFVLRFKNRSSVRRYLGEQFTNMPSSGPHPLTQKGTVKNIIVKDKKGNDVHDPPSPSIRMVKTEHPANDNQHYDVYSEVYIH